MPEKSYTAMSALHLCQVKKKCFDRPGVCQVPEGSREQGKKEETGCEIICGAPTTLDDDDNDETANKRSHDFYTHSSVLSEHKADKL